MSEAGCAFCTVVAALERASTCPARDAGHVLRKVQNLPASIAILAPDQYYQGYTMVVSKTHATELYDLPDHESAQFFDDMRRVARAIVSPAQDELRIARQHRRTPALAPLPAL
jgi:diadenosine tetraphosphate (Ap4A) HIT family hydrolase